MIRRGDVWSEDGIVIAVEQDPAHGARLAIETDRKLTTAVSRESAADRRVTVWVFLSPAAWAALLRQHGGAVDNLLGRRVALRDLDPNVEVA